MPRLSNIQRSEIRDITVDHNGIELTFTVDPNAFTMGWQQAVSDANGAEELSEVFFELVKGWDITDDDDNVLPLDVTAFEQITLPTFIALSGLIATELLPKTPRKTRRSSRRS